MFSRPIWSIVEQHTDHLEGGQRFAEIVAIQTADKQKEATLGVQDILRLVRGQQRCSQR